MKAIAVIISIHASLAGGDSGTGRFFQMGDISIHASLAGGDMQEVAKECRRPYFNPRLPRGRRPARRSGHSHRRDISIHASLAGGDGVKRAEGGQQTISIHASLAGGDQARWSVFRVYARFQSTPPSREATRNAIMAFISFAISIHASLAGGDKSGWHAFPVEEISIHASLAGGDVLLWRLV